MIFDIKKTAILKSVRTERFFIFKYANFLSKAFLYLFIISLFFVGISFFGAAPALASSKASILLIALYILFWNLSLFAQFKLKSPVSTPSKKL